MLREATKSLGRGNDHVMRLTKRVQLCNDEIGEMDQVQQEQEDEEMTEEPAV
jgi:uncharacterized protein YdcH (DUF465 family)